jgi:hypothetical protein
MAGVGFEASGAVQRAALTPTGPTRDHDRGQPLFSPDVMMAGWAGPESTRKSSPSLSQSRNPPPAQVESVLLSGRERVVP